MRFKLSGVSLPRQAVLMAVIIILFFSGSVLEFFSLQNRLVFLLYFLYTETVPTIRRFFYVLNIYFYDKALDIAEC